MHRPSGFFLKGALLALSLPAALAASGVIPVPLPNGTDDTKSLQAALNQAVAEGPGCIVQLAPGLYKTQQLVAFNFRGTFRGAGMAATTLQALPGLIIGSSFAAGVTSHAGLPTPLGGGNTYPDLLTFFGGDITISDLTITVPATNSTETAGWWLLVNGGYTEYALDALIEVQGTAPTNATLLRTALLGEPDPNSPFLFNLLNGIDYSIWSDGPLAGNALAGDLTIKGCRFSGQCTPISFDDIHQNNRVVIGGSPEDGNTFIHCAGGMDLETAQNSTFEISFNKATGMNSGMWVVDNGSFVPTSPSFYNIHDNEFVSTLAWNDPLYLWDNASAPWIRGTIGHNLIKPEAAAGDGIGLYYCKGVSVLDNTVLGYGEDGIGLWASTDCSVVDNQLAGFAAEAVPPPCECPCGCPFAQIVLDSGTSHDLVISLDPATTVINLGTDNQVLEGRVTTSKDPAAALLAIPTDLSKRPELFRKPQH